MNNSDALLALSLRERQHTEIKFALIFTTFGFITQDWTRVVAAVAALYFLTGYVVYSWVYRALLRRFEDYEQSLLTHWKTRTKTTTTPLPGDKP